MGWLDSFFGSSKESDDALGRIDSKSRQFLQKESPLKLPPKPEPPASQTKEPEVIPEKPIVPKESFFQDGRYAHLWKTYRPLNEIEAESKTGHDQLMEVLEVFQQRKNIIGRAALENCALQQEEWRKCMTSGSWTDKMQMCRQQVRKFERCYNMQSRFLRVLGYRSVQGRNPIVDEDIQMHADVLYQRMIAHEDAVALAKKEGRPTPEFEIIPHSVVAPDPGPKVREAWKDVLAKLPEEERAIEEAALRRDYIEKQDTAEKVKGIWTREDEERRKRTREGKATAMDHFWNLVRN